MPFHIKCAQNCIRRWLVRNVFFYVVQNKAYRRKEHLEHHFLYPINVLYRFLRLGFLNEGALKLNNDNIIYYKYKLIIYHKAILYRVKTLKLPIFVYRIKLFVQSINAYALSDFHTFLKMIASVLRYTKYLAKNHFYLPGE